MKNFPKFSFHCRHLDFFNILTYGLLTNEPYTQHNAPLKKIQLIMREWITKNVDFNKMLLGVEFGGRKFDLKDANDNKPGAECIGHSTLIKSFAINELKTEQWTTINGPKGDFVYSYCGNQWISHESNDTVKAKAQYASENKMSGVVMMALNYEGSAESPLLDVIYKELNK